MCKQYSPLPDPFLKHIGTIAVYWSAIEAEMELAILGIQGMDMNRGMVITTNLGFRSRHDLLMTMANSGGINDESAAAELKKILKRINDAYPKRNGIIHTVWRPSDDLDIAIRMGIRTKGKLKIVHEPVSVDDLAKIADEMRLIGIDITAFMERYGLRPETGEEDAP